MGEPTLAQRIGELTLEIMAHDREVLGWDDAAQLAAERVLDEVPEQVAERWLVDRRADDEDFQQYLARLCREALGLEESRNQPCDSNDCESCGSMKLRYCPNLDCAQAKEHALGVQELYSKYGLEEKK